MKRVLNINLILNNILNLYFEKFNYVSWIPLKTIYSQD